MRPFRSILTFPVLSALLLLVQSALLLQVPLMNVLGLEFSIASAPLVCLLLGLASIRSRSRGPDGPESTPYKHTLRVLRSFWWFLLLPGGVAALNALAIRNCTFPEGLGYYLLVVPFAGVLGIALAECCRSFFPRVPVTVFVLAWLALLFHIVGVTFAGPQIFAFNPVVGFFPGLSYDDTLDALSQLALYRLTTVLLIIALLHCAHVIPKGSRGWRNVSGRSLLLTASFWMMLLALWLGSDRLGFSSSLARIERELGGVRRTAHFLIVYPLDRFTDDEADRLAQYHDFLFSRMSKTLNVFPTRTIVSIVYGSPEQKTRLVGGGRTNFTKPWLWQMHLSADGVRGVLKHELVHVFAAEFGFPLIRVGLNSGFIEGLAVALERESYGMALERAAASIMVVRGSADLSSVFSLTGFFGSHSSVSYTLAGSFCRFLIERYGVRRFKRAYRTGSFGIYGKPFGDLVGEWRQRIGRVELTEGELLKAAYLFDRPPSFVEECYHDKGNTLRDARQAMADGRDSVAALLAEASYLRSPSSEAAAVGARALVRLGEYAKALDVAGLQYVDTIGVKDLSLALARADALWGLGRVGEARKDLAVLVRMDVSDGWTEAAAFREAVITSYPDQTEPRVLVLGTIPDSVKQQRWEAFGGPKPTPLLQYAIARTMASGADDAALLEVLPGFGLPGSSALSYVARRRLSAVYSRSRNFEKAKAVLWEAQNDVSDDVRLREIAEDIEWLDWLKASYR